MIIDTFHADYVIPKDRGDPSAVQKRLDHIAASLLEKEVEPLLPQMGLPHDPLVFIKQIALEMTVNLEKPGERANDRDIARHWARQMIAVIKKSLAHMPTSYTLPDAADNIIIFPNRAAYLAHFLHDLAVSGNPRHTRNTWYYREFKDLDSFSPREIVKLLCQQNRDLLEAILLALKESNGLAKTLETLTEDDARFIYDLLPGASAIEIAITMDSIGGPHEAILRCIAEILAKGRAGSAMPYSEAKNYKLCLLLYLEYVSPGQPPGPGTKAWVKKAIETIIIEKPEVLQGLETGKSKKAGAAKKIKTAYGGLFLLIPAIIESRLIESITQSSSPQAGEIPAISNFLYTMALTLARQNAEYPALVESDDPGFYIFAGLDPGMLATDEHRQAWTPPPSVPSVASVANNNKDIGFETALATAKELVLRLFARRLAGFEKSSPPYLFQNFIRRGSEITVKEDTIQVKLSAKPLDTVLRLSGLLEETPRVSWWGNKTLVMQLQGESK